MSKNYSGSNADLMPVVHEFEERFVNLCNDGQITLNCDEAEDLLEEANSSIVYDIDTIPDGKMVRVTVGDNEEGDNEHLECGDIGFFTWKPDESREDGFFLSFCEESREWCYVDYEDMEECRFELIYNETIELEC